MIRASTILLVDDDDVDVMSVRRAFKKNQINNPLHVESNGEEGVRYLRECLSRHRPLPRLILLDMNMPKMNGFEFLKVVKNDSLLKSIPVVVLTSSNIEKDRLSTYKLNVSGYVTKPVDFIKLTEAIQTIHLYWRLNALPPAPSLETVEEDGDDFLDKAS